MVFKSVIGRSAASIFDDFAKRFGVRKPSCAFSLLLILNQTKAQEALRTPKRFAKSISFLFFGALCLLNSCERLQHKNPQPVHFQQNIMTIDYHISIGDPLTQEKKRQVQKIIEATFKEIDDVYNKWNPRSQISLLNNLPANTPYSPPPQLYRFLVRLNHFVELSGGRFDPTIEPLHQLWKIHLEQGKTPSKEEIEALKPAIGWDKIHLVNGLFYKDHAETQLDLGGVAKGLCVDLLIERLHQSGLQNLYVEWGGEIRTLGHHPSNRPWHIYIPRLADPDPSKALVHLDLINQALATSGDYFQYWKITANTGEEKNYCHIINPLTCSPLEIKKGSIASASLIALDCTTADALAKVLMLFDSAEEAKEWFNKQQADIPSSACWLIER